MPKVKIDGMEVEVLQDATVLQAHGVVGKQGQTLEAGE